MRKDTSHINVYLINLLILDLEPCSQKTQPWSLCFCKVSWYNRICQCFSSLFMTTRVLIASQEVLVRLFIVYLIISEITTKVLRSWPGSKYLCESTLGWVNPSLRGRPARDTQQSKHKEANTGWNKFCTSICCSSLCLYCCQFFQVQFQTLLK